MSDITDFKSVPISELFTDIDRYKYNPSNIQRAILDRLEDVTNGKVDIVDPTNPFVFLLESSCVATAVAVNENNINLRKQYASLAQTDDELYIHMSDRDFVNRFSTPAVTKFKLMLQLTDLLGKMIDAPQEDCRKVVIPRNTEFSVNDLTFSIQYPIVIREFYSGVIQISYETSVVSPLQNLTTNIIDYIIRKDPTGVEWIYFEVDVTQFIISDNYYPVLSGSYFTQTIDFKDYYYYCRVFYKNNSTNNSWVEILTTHTDQVFDPYKPTALLKVIDNNVTVSIPQVYVNKQLVDGSIRVDVYQTKGKISVNMKNYLMSAFTTRFRAIDTDRDITPYTAAMNNVAYVAYSDATINGGVNGKTFEELREQVIDNALGDHKLPITNVQIESAAQDIGFSVVRNVDLLTNRIFLATKNLPLPLNKRLITPATMTVDTAIVSLGQLKTLDEIRDNGPRLTITPDTLFKNNNGIISIYPRSKVDALLNLLPTTRAEIIPKENLLYTPFYYVLDNTELEFDIRAYQLDQPITDNLNFISQNPTIGSQVNTQRYTIERTNYGYRIIVVTKSSDSYKNILQDNVSAQLSFIPVREKDRAYVNGTFLGFSPDKERVFEFRIETNLDVDNEDNLVITNFKMYSNENILVKTNLTAQFDIIYTTNSIDDNFIPDAANNQIGRFMLPSGSSAITQESIRLNFGFALKNLWKRSRSVVNSSTYATHIADIPLTYENDVYQIDPITNSIFSFDVNGDIQYTILHNKGDVVLDAEGEIVYKYRKGDVILDEQGNPVPVGSSDIVRHIDIFFVDSLYYFATDESYRGYLNEVAKTVTTWVSEDLNQISDKLLEQTKIYFYPNKSMGSVKVLTENDFTTTIDAKQKLSVEFYVTSQIYSNSQMREQISKVTTLILEDHIKRSTVSVSDMIVDLKSVLANDIVSVRVKGLGGVNNYETVTIVNQHEQLSIGKRLNVLEDDSIIVQEDIDISFINYQS